MPGASSRAFWEKFDEYVKGIRHEQVKPSRNKHLLTATEALKVARDFLEIITIVGY